MHALSSIIVFRNAEETLQQTIDSISEAARHIPEYPELIFVDNGSSDNSATIAKYFGASYPFATYVFEPIEGVSNSRNRGLAISSGKYISFIDADDLVQPEYFTSLYGAMQSSADIILCPRANRRGSNGAVSLDNFIRLIEGWWCWQFAFKRSVVAGSTFEGLCYEDFIFFPKLLDNCGTFAVLSAPIYTYQYNPSSLTRRSAAWRLGQLESHFNIQLRRALKNRRLERRVMTDYLNALSHLRAISRSSPVLSMGELIRYASENPLLLARKAAWLFRLQASVTWHRYRNGQHGK